MTQISTVTRRQLILKMIAVNTVDKCYHNATCRMCYKGCDTTVTYEMNYS